MKKLMRVFLMPFGFIKKMLEIANEGARDIENKFRFKNVIIDKGCSFDSKTIVHPYVHLLENCIINNSEINSYTYLGKNCLIQNTTIGKFCSIANDVIIGLGNHPLGLLSTSPIFYRVNNPLKIKLVKNNSNFVEYKDIKIGNDVWIGARAIILDGISIGNGAVVAANSVVTKDVPAYAIVGGSPAKVIRHRFALQKCQELDSSKWWELELETIKKDFIILNK